ncbi:luciferase [Dictyobacter alpinus]|uniref:Luciferase n=1 Tax=Dictyobacter alpinus TaxID=2014873 RepID=A0A402BDC0_9CHLR|nr:LLM class flavin-dependent oxidoreductase [Dictyobacter alpinus]GCE29401.1 luciferase [Dictyobacter alpinus]
MAAERGKPTGPRILNASVERQTPVRLHPSLEKASEVSFGGIMKIGLGLPESIPGVEGQTILEWARKAEAGPFSCLSVFDRLVYTNYEPLLTLAAVAAATQRIRLMSSVLLAPLRSPALLVKMVTTLDALSNSRLSLGLGIGGREEDFQAVGVPLTQRAQILEEQLTLLKHNWFSQPMSESIGPLGPPIVSSAGPEILLGGYTHKAVRRVGRWGDGYLAGITTPAEALKLYQTVEASWQEAGREGKPRFVGGLCFALGPNARERAQPYITHYFGSENLLHSILVTPEELQRALEARMEVGMDEVLLWPCLPELDQVERAAEVVHTFLSGNVPI